MSTESTDDNLIDQDQQEEIDNDDREHLIKSSNKRTDHTDGTIDSIERCSAENQLDTNIVTPHPRSDYFTVEPIFFLIFTASTISEPVITNLLLSQVCTNTDFHNMTTPVNCSNMSRPVEEQLQPIVADIQMFRTLLECGFPAFLSFFLGPWSDVNGRKPLMISSVFGTFLCYLTWSILTFIPNLPPVAVLITSIPIALSGGFVTFFLASFCYCSDVTSIESRALRMGLLQVALYTGLLTGNLISAPLFSYGGFPLVFIVSAILSFLGFLYSLFVLKESIILCENRKTYVFDCELVADMLATCFKKRPYYIRPQIFFCMLSACIFLVIFNGEGSVLYLGVRDRFKWDLQDYTKYNCFSVALVGIGTFFGLWFSKMLKIPDMMFALIVLLVRVPTSLLCAVARDGRYFYISAIVNMFGTTGGPLIRSHLSKIVPQHDLGKVFALTASAEALTPLAAAPLYTYVYNNSVSSMHGAVYYLSAGLSVTTTLLVSCVLIFHLKSPSSLSSNTGSIVS